MESGGQSPKATQRKDLEDHLYSRNRKCQRCCRKLVMMTALCTFLAATAAGPVSLLVVEEARLQSLKKRDPRSNSPQYFVSE